VVFGASLNWQTFMDYQRQNNGSQTFLEHWGMTLTVLIVVIVSQIVMFFFNLSGQPWIYFFLASIVLLISGAGLIVWAKLPVYRSGRLFTFGIKSVPKNLAGCYRWGWRVFLFGVVLSLCLLLSKQ
jgi:hypothetical protein